ncbi:sensor histidine kinase [Sporosarcina sp. D27]|uniref:GAF domain-containing sensor histidine kinase n=1 Tax=Sporosarcina sp. D27 TaxID=1382305 RepID=UPI0005615AEA|nr:sensor histidine kinase [Sporosarcina sp. D27]
MRERVSSFYIYTICFLGLLAVIMSIVMSELPSTPIILVLLAIFMGVIEYFPIRISRGGITLTLTLVYPMIWEFGIHLTVIVAVCVMVTTHSLRRLSMQRTLYNAGQFAISLVLGAWLTRETLLIFGANLPMLYEGLLSILLFSIFFCIFNALFFDILMVLLPQPYLPEQWHQKNILVLLSTSFCLLYAASIYLLEQQYNEKMGGVAILFFFFPLVAICVISYSSRQTRIEKERLYKLFSITTELSQGLSAGNLNQMKQSLEGFLGIQAYALWAKEEEKWKLLLKDGAVHSECSIDFDSKLDFEQISQTLVISDWKTGMAPGDGIFENVIRSLVYLPLTVNHELVGMFVVGKSRAASFIAEDIQSLATFSYQLGGLLKTQSLISEQEKRIILEERNRLAHEIHDGIAQVLAGVIFQMESAQKQSANQSGNMYQVVDNSIKKLRESLSDTRFSIYALKPYPTQRLGLKQAIANKIQAVKQEHDLDITYHEKGRSRRLSTSKEKAIFDTVQEGLQNITKHAMADKVNIHLSYQREHVFLKVKDNGIGFSLFESMIKTKHEPHYGILHMNEQAEQLGATLQIDSSVGNGTVITLLIPDLEKGEEYHDSNTISG